MQYHDGSTVTLGDIVNVPVPTGTARARVVMLGESYEHLDIDPNFLPKYAPVGNYMFSPLDEWVTRDA